MEKFKYITWCDLGIVSLKIHSYFLWDTKMVYTIDEPFSNKPIVNLFICYDDDCVFNKQKLYRESAMQRGFYVGHHFGTPVKLKHIDDNNIAISCSDPGKIIWCYIIKYILTIYSTQNDVLHIKGGAIEYMGKAFILLGRGASGKTQVINELCKNGAKLISNTHLLISHNNVLGIKSNMRIREDGAETYVPYDTIDKEKTFDGWLPIANVLWLNYRTDGRWIIKEMPYDYAVTNLYWFSEAIGNWELKEDVADYCNSDPFAFAIMLNKIHEMINEFCSNNNIYYLNSDILLEENAERLIRFMRESIMSNELKESIM